MKLLTAPQAPSEEEDAESQVELPGALGIDAVQKLELLFPVCVLCILISTYGKHESPQDLVSIYFEHSQTYRRQVLQRVEMNFSPNAVCA